MKTYWVWWSFVNNHLKEVKKIEAESIEEAIKQSTIYDPRVTSPRGERMQFFVFQEVACAGSTSLVVVHTGPVKDERTFMEHLTGVTRE
tara:strand:- start:4157 stop:4423 length:267 start_codon:yes stop_codon:yes gene_type:complete